MALSSSDVDAFIAIPLNKKAILPSTQIKKGGGKSGSKNGVKGGRDSGKGKRK